MDSISPHILAGLNNDSFKVGFSQYKSGIKTIENSQPLDHPSQDNAFTRTVTNPKQ